MTLDNKIDNLKPGESFIMSKAPNGMYCSVERGTGPNKNKLRFIRYQANGSWEVFKTCTI